MEKKMETTKMLICRDSGLGSGGLSKKVNIGIIRVNIWVIGDIHLLTKSA